MGSLYVSGCVSICQCSEGIIFMNWRISSELAFHPPSTLIWDQLAVSSYICSSSQFAFVSWWRHFKSYYEGWMLSVFTRRPCFDPLSFWLMTVRVYLCQSTLRVAVKWCQFLSQHCLFKYRHWTTPSNLSVQFFCNGCIINLIKSCSTDIFTGTCQTKEKTPTQWNLGNLA